MNKRLIKAEYLTTKLDFAGRNIEVFKNPTSKEFYEIKELPFSWGEIRGIIEKDGTLYMWSSGLLHEAAIEMFGLPMGINISGNKEKIEIYIQSNVNLDFTLEAFKNCTTLYNFFNRSTRIEGFNCNYYGAQRDPAYVSFKTIGDILNYNKENEEKISRLIKRN